MTLFMRFTVYFIYLLIVYKLSIYYQYYDKKINTFKQILILLKLNKTTGVLRQVVFWFY